MVKGIGIKTFGEFKIYLDGELVTDIPARKAEALLVYLALERDTAHRRESLFTLLWPGMPETSARHNLRQLLYTLRQTFPGVGKDKAESKPLLLADRQTIQLNPEAAIDCDVHAFDRVLESTQVHDHLNLAGCETCLHALQEAVNLYQGGFLSDFYLEDSNPFEDWTQSLRQSYRRKVLDTLASLGEIHIQKANYDQARACADRQLQIDPLREWQRLGIWLDESRDDIRLQRLLAAAPKEWLESGRDPGFLLRGTRLEQFSEWADTAQVDLTGDERDYLDASLEARREREQAEAERQAREATLEVRSRRFLRLLVGVFALAAVIAAILSIVAFNQRGIAQGNAWLMQQRRRPLRSHKVKPWFWRIPGPPSKLLPNPRSKRVPSLKPRPWKTATGLSKQNRMPCGRPASAWLPRRSPDGYR